MPGPMSFVERARTEVRKSLGDFTVGPEIAQRGNRWETADRPSAGWGVEGGGSGWLAAALAKQPGGESLALRDPFGLDGDGVHRLLDARQALLDLAQLGRANARGWMPWTQDPGERYDGSGNDGEAGESEEQVGIHG